MLLCLFMPNIWSLEEIVNEFDSFNRNLTELSFCEDPGKIRHGVRQPEVKPGALFPYKSQLLFNCNPGYVLQPNVKKMVCGSNGKWQPLSKPRCRPVMCPRPSISHGYVLVNGPDFSPKTSLEVHCENGYRLANKFVNMLECTMTGTWTGHNGAFTEEFPECVEATCPPLHDIENSNLLYEGSRGWDHGFKEGSKAKYACRQGFQMYGQGNGEGLCHNGIWTGNMKITCERLECDPPPSVVNAEVRIIENGVTLQTGIAYPVGISIIYWCYSGYAIMGSTSKLTCLQNGQWSPRQRPACQKVNTGKEKVQCRTPPTIQFGFIDDNQENYYAFSKVKYSCREGFHLVGPPELTCDVNGHWQPYKTPTCELSLDEPSFDWSSLGNVPYAPEKPHASEAPVQTWDSTGAQALSLLTAGCVMGILFLVLIIAVFTQRRGCRSQMCHIQLRSSVSSTNITGSLQEPPLYHDQDRAALIAFADGGHVALPSYEEATNSQQPSDLVYNGNAVVHRPLGFSANRHNRCVVLRSSGSHEHNNCNVGVPPRQLPPPASHSACQRSSSLADSLGSTDTVTPSEVSTTVTVDTLSSTMSHHPSSTSSTRAFCGSLTSFDTAGSGSVLNIEGVPLLEESETEKILTPTESQSVQLHQNSHDHPI